MAAASINEVEQDLLLFIAAHELVLAIQAADLFKVDERVATGWLESLRERGLLSRVRVSSRSPAAYRITVEGQALVDAALPELGRLAMDAYRHEVAVGWLWLAAKHGVFGQLRERLSRREMQAADASLRTEALLDTPGVTFGVAGVDGAQLAASSYPDLALVLSSWGWIAVYAQLVVPDRGDLKTLLVRYDRDERARGVLFMVDDAERVGARIIEVAEEIGVSELVRVQRLNPDIAGG